MVKTIIRVAVFIITFFTVLVIASHVLNKDHDNMTMEMAQATLPTVTMLCDEMEYNRLFGYTVSMDYPSQRDSLTILGENRNVDFVIDPYDREVSKIGAQLRSVDGERLIEVLELQGMPQGENLRVELALKDLIEKNKEYLLTIQVELDGWQQVDFYTRVIWNPQTHLKEDLQYVLDFHEKLYHREAAKELVKYLESNSKLESNRSFYKVNIHSSFKQITWGDMKVTEKLAPVFTLKELSSQYCVLVGDYQVTAGETDSEKEYRMREYFRVRYTADRMYLLNYERTMTQIPREEELCGGDKLLLGIGDENVLMAENESGSTVAFSQADCLYAYQSTEQKLTKIFQFYDRNSSDVRNLHDEHEVKILQVDDEGNVDFAVYGYMNRGIHEGEVGVRICRYDAGLNVVEERAFLPWNKPFSNLQAQMKELLYLGEQELLYLYLDGTVYQVNLETGEQEIVLQALWDNYMRVSADHQILVYQKEQEHGGASELYVHDLKNGARAVLKAGYGEKLMVLGFMDQDIIYGAASEEQIIVENSGQVFFPVKRLFIAKKDGTVVKEYAQEDFYVISCEVEENQIVLERMTQKEDGSFTAAPQDHITRTQKTTAGKNVVSTVDIDVYERYVQIQVSAKIDSKKLQILSPKEVVYEGRRSITLDRADMTPGYYVYGPYGVEGICQLAGNAVNLAAEISGVVVSDRGGIVWQKGNLSSRNQILSIKEPEKATMEESLAVCLDAMLAQRGVTVSSAQLLESGYSPMEIMEKVTTMSPADMTGCTMEAMLYFVNGDVPVLGILQEEAVLITGFNESQVVIFQPSSGKLAKMGRKDADKWFSENGNCFLTFLLDF